jgi:hypothetical protein
LRTEWIEIRYKITATGGIFSRLLRLRLVVCFCECPT